MGVTSSSRRHCPCAQHLVCRQCRGQCQRGPSCVGRHPNPPDPGLQKAGPDLPLTPLSAAWAAPPPPGLTAEPSGVPQPPRHSDPGLLSAPWRPQGKEVSPGAAQDLRLDPDPGKAALGSRGKLFLPPQLLLCSPTFSEAAPRLGPGALKRSCSLGGHRASLTELSGGGSPTPAPSRAVLGLLPRALPGCPRTILAVKTVPLCLPGAGSSRLSWWKDGVTRVCSGCSGGDPGPAEKGMCLSWGLSSANRSSPVGSEGWTPALVPVHCGAHKCLAGEGVGPECWGCGPRQGDLWPLCLHPALLGTGHLSPSAP